MTSTTNLNSAPTSESEQYANFEQLKRQHLRKLAMKQESEKKSNSAPSPPMDSLFSQLPANQKYAWAAGPGTVMEPASEESEKEPASENNVTRDTVSKVTSKCFSNPLDASQLRLAYEEEIEPKERRKKKKMSTCGRACLITSYVFLILCVALIILSGGYLLFM